MRIKKVSVTRVAPWLVALLLTGCAAAPQPPTQPAAPDPVASRIDATLSKAAQERNVDVDTPRPQAIYGWKSTTVDYFGDAAVFLREVAQGVGLKAVVTGPQPALPIFIRIQAKDEPLQEVLRRVAEQFGGRADVVLRDGSIEMRYRPQ